RVDARARDRLGAGGRPLDLARVDLRLLPSVGGTPSFPGAGSGGGSASIDTSTLLDKLESAFMGSLEVHDGRWGAFTDLLYVNFGASSSAYREFTIGGTPIPADASTSARIDLKGSIWTLGAAYRVVATPRSTVEAIAGIRRLGIEQSFSWTLSGNLGPISPADRSGARAADLEHWDAFVGVRGRAAFGADGRWFVPYHLDVGTGESRFVRQAMLGGGRAFDWGEVMVAWRHIDYTMKSDETIRSLSFSGPMVAASFVW
ncbi:MAG: hypothetical protein O9972_37930, partial [Burkholderiales bacterium]|nr:hypothetical protein [Burkholderiales bacterium]